jgi:hypothetical protein
VDETEDEGTGFFLKLEDGRILFLCGQLFYELEDQKQFPCDRFEYAITPNSKWPLGFECTGHYIPIAHNRPAFSSKDMKRGLTPCDGDLFVGDFDALKSDIWPLPTDVLDRES